MIKDLSKYYFDEVYLYFVKYIHLFYAITMQTDLFWMYSNSCIRANSDIAKISPLIQRSTTNINYSNRSFYVRVKMLIIKVFATIKRCGRAISKNGLAYWYLDL